MDYRKFKADLLFTGTELLEAGSVLITDSKGEIVEITKPEDAGENIETFQGLLCPGFINTHCHVELSHMKGRIPPGSGLVNFLTRVIKERNFPPEKIEASISEAINEIYESGTIAVGDTCNTSISFEAKNKSRISWQNFIEIAGFTPAPADRFTFASNLLREWEINFPSHENSNGLPNRACLIPHAPYSVSEQLFRLIDKNATEIISIHNQESAAENELFSKGSGPMFQLYNALGINADFFQASGKSSIQTYLSLLTTASKIILVHNSFTSAEDLQFIKNHADKHSQQVFFSICVNANLYIESVLPPLMLIREKGCNICLGTDSYASNYSLNMLDEIKQLQQRFPQLRLPEMLGWATINGAKALEMDKMIGSFEEGKKPGILHIDNIEEQKISSKSVVRRLI